MFWIFEFNSESYCELLDEAKQNFSDFTQVEKAYRGMEKAVVKLNTKFNWESLLQWSSTQSLTKKTFEKTPLSEKKIGETKLLQLFPPWISSQFDKMWRNQYGEEKTPQASDSWISSQFPRLPPKLLKLPK